MKKVMFGVLVLLLLTGCGVEEETGGRQNLCGIVQPVLQEIGNRQFY